MVLSYTKESLGYSALSDIIATVAKEGKLGVKLRADNDFYSQIKEVSSVIMFFVILMQFVAEHNTAPWTLDRRFQNA